jgi:cation-transporting ATPase E
VPLGLLSFSDELRPDASQTLARFAAAGIAIKIISGDNPHTVAALARQAGLGPEIRTMTGQKLASLDASQLPDAVGSTTVFGRISPQQKATLVQVLKQRGHYVAMTGDGINDVMALKQAHLGIAMEAGSQATRAVADLVLLGNSFSALPAAFEEGQRIRNGMQDVLKLFLTRLLVVTVLVGAVGFVGGFAFTPRQVSLVGFMTVGLPTVVLAARAGTGMMDPRNRLLSIFHFVLPAGLSLAASALTTYLVVLYAHSRWLMAASPGLTHAEAMQGAVPAAQTGLAVMLVLCGLALVPFVVPPFARWQPGGAPHLRPMGALTNPGDQDVDARPTVVAMLLLVSFAVILATPTLRDLFEMVPLGKLEYALIAGQALLWVLLMRWAWRRQVLERFLYGEMPI